MSSKQDVVTITVTRFQAEFLLESIVHRDRLYSTDNASPYLWVSYIQKRAQIKGLVIQLGRAVKQFGTYNLADYS
jgi:hypothetical protein